MAGVEMSGQGGLDERFRAIDPVVRPFAVSIGYDGWAEQAGFLDSVVGEVAYDSKLAGVITDEEMQPIAASTPRVIRAACELGYISRLHTQSLVVDNTLGDGLSEAILGNDYRAQQCELHEEYTGALRHARPDSPQWARMLALGELIGTRARVASQAFLWGRVGTQMFLRGNSDVPSTVRHHGDLVTTDASLEASKIEQHMKEFTIDDPDYSPLEKLALWRDGSRRYRELRVSGRQRNLSRYNMGRWLREGGDRIRVREDERETFRQELRANPVQIDA